VSVSKHEKRKGHTGSGHKRHLCILHFVSFSLFSHPQSVNEGNYLAVADFDETSDLHGRRKCSKAKGIADCHISLSGVEIKRISTAC